MDTSYDTLEAQVTSDTVVRRLDSGYIWTISYLTAQSVHQQILLLGLNWREGQKGHVPPISGGLVGGGGAAAKFFRALPTVFAPPPVFNILFHPWDIIL